MITTFASTTGTSTTTTATSTTANNNKSKKKKKKNNSHTTGTSTNKHTVRQRPVSFGNPALGTYHGYVYTMEQRTSTGSDCSSTAGTSSSTDNSSSRRNKTKEAGNHNNRHQNNSRRGTHQHVDDENDDHRSLYHLLQSTHRPLIEGGDSDCGGGGTTTPSRTSGVTEETTATAMEVRNIAAMVNVPPNQVPDGMLHVSLSHRPYIRHVRIMISETTTTTTVADSTTTTTTTTDDATKIETANEEEDVTTNESTKTDSTTKSNTTTRHENVTTTDHTTDRTYLVLFELGNEDEVDQFVNDLHGQPYTYLDDTVTCQVYHVVALQGIGGGDGDGGGGDDVRQSSSSSYRSPLLFAPVTTATTAPHQPSSSLSLSTLTTTDGTNSSNNNNNSNRAVDDFFCAVCLETMDVGTSHGSCHGISAVAVNHDENNHFNETTKSILTTVCNHSFHIDCLAQWQDSPCPVCRYDHAGLNDDALLSQCHICSTTHNNYVCLICGIVSCGGDDGGTAGNRTSSHTSVYNDAFSASTSQCTVMDRSSTSDDGCHSSTDDAFDVSFLHQRQRYQILPNSHAQKHYDESLHAYALCTETQHVWDFAGHGYVHRLLQNKDDGKIVEVNDPMNTTSQERSMSPGLTQAQEGEVVHRKLESFANQYYTLLKSQLEQQRIYYEGRLEEIRREYSNSNQAAATNQQRKPTKRVDTAADLIVALKQERQQLIQRLETIKAKTHKVNEDVTFLKNLNESLEANRESLRQQLDEARRERAETRKMLDESLPPLQEKVTQLMLQLESSTGNSNNVSESSNDDLVKGAAVDDHRHAAAK